MFLTKFDRKVQQSQKLNSCKKMQNCGIWEYKMDKKYYRIT